MIRNVTFTAEARLIDDARAVALSEKTTLNEEFRRWLETYARKKQAERAMEVIDRIGRYASSGGRSFTREERNERKR
jgi:hypothetical protein